MTVAVTLAAALWSPLMMIAARYLFGIGGPRWGEEPSERVGGLEGPPGSPGWIVVAALLGPVLLTGSAVTLIFLSLWTL